jgi:UDP-2,3-diacylglucosamine pyrophosphatase LpxH
MSSFAKQAEGRVGMADVSLPRKLPFRIRVLSDLHIGVPGTGSNDFLLDDEAFLAYLDASLESANVVVLNGDVFECWEGNLVRNSEQRFREIAEARPALVEGLRQRAEAGRLVVVAGNHDAIVRTAKLFPAVESWTQREYGVLLHVAHGHQADAFNAGLAGGGLGGCGRCISACVGLGESLLYADLDHDLSALQAICTGERDASVMLDHAERLAARNSYDVVVYGHSHDATVEPILRGAALYANSGTASGSRDAVDKVDLTITPDARVEVVVASTSVLGTRPDHVISRTVSTAPDRAVAFALSAL